MHDPQPFPPPPEAAGNSGEDPRIEQLLVSGLDHYFAGEFETAISLWTRVLFLDRQHNRARAYIERARSAQAERHRETEALVHEGLDAFDRGDVDTARALLSDAMARGAPHDLALGVLDRIDRLDVTGTREVAHAPARRPPRGQAHRAERHRHVRRRSWSRFWLVTAAVAMALGAASWWVSTTSGWADSWARRPIAAPAAALPETLGPLPVPTPSEIYLARGQSLFESGRLADALVQLNKVSAGDPLRARADELRARVQRELLALALSEPATTPSPSTAPGGRPPE